MTTSGSESWICLNCGQSNFYVKHSCIHCGQYRVGDNDPEPISEEIEHPPPDKAINSQLNSRKRYVFLALACLSFFAWASLMTEFRKWGANWGGFPVLLVAVVAAVVMSRWLVRKSWFTDRTTSTRWRFMIIPTVVFVFSAAAGTYLTEPSRGRTGAVVDRGSADYRYDYN